MILKNIKLKKRLTERGGLAARIINTNAEREREQNQKLNSGSTRARGHRRGSHAHAMTQQGLEGTMDVHAHLTAHVTAHDSMRRSPSHLAALPETDPK